MEDFLTVHKFSDITGVPVDTLRYYDRIDLLKPAHVNPNNNYRYYTVSQFYNLSLIKYLRSFDVPIPEIKSYLQKQQMDSTISLIENSMDIITNKIDELHSLQQALERRMYYLRLASSAKSNINRITLNKFNKRFIFSTGNIFQSPEEISAACLELDMALTNSITASFLYQIGIIIFQENLHCATSTSRSTLFSFIEEKDRVKLPSEFITEMPSGYFVCGYHSGPFTNRDEVLKKLIAFINNNGYKVSGDALQIKLIDENETTNRKDFLYQIQIPVILNE